jgi:hypothetical protein
LNSSALAGRNLRQEKLADVSWTMVARARQIVAQRRWAEKNAAWERVRQAQARRAEAEEQAAALIDAWGQWEAKEQGYQAQCEAWATGWAGRLEQIYGRPSLWRVTYTATTPALLGEEAAWTLTTVVMEAPEDVAQYRTLALVTEVSVYGSVTDGVRLGAIVRMEPVEWGNWPEVRASLPYCRSVWAGRFVVNVPPEATPERPEVDRPVKAHGELKDWLSERGFERQVERMRYDSWAYADLVTMEVAEVAERFFL